jgi:hypothetical protein
VNSLGHCLLLDVPAEAILGTPHLWRMG